MGLHTRFLIEIGIPEPEPEEHRIKEQAVEDQVREAIECIESGYKSDLEWVLLNKLYRELMCLRHKSPRVQNLINMISPILAKYGYHGVEAVD